MYLSVVSVSNTTAGSDLGRFPRFRQVDPERVILSPDSIHSSEQTHLLTRLTTPGYRLIRPITLQVETLRDGSVLVGDYEFDLYGVGETLHDALADYESMLIDQYQDLRGDETRIGKHLTKQLLRLRATIIEV
ncbi:MAG: hypothetical protein IT330_05890 [Anaerolineae bacterium]|nr:hypothetical protein [Anaerolineae bacterium]